MYMCVWSFDCAGIAAATGTQLRVRTTPAPSVRLFSGSGDSAIAVWNVVPGTCELELVRRVDGHTGSVYALEIHESDLFSGGNQQWGFVSVEFGMLLF